MIVNFRHRGLKRLFEKGDRSKLPPEQVERIQTILARLNIAEVIEEMNIFSFRLHPLTGNFKGFWSVTVRANWRIIFRFENGSAFDVDYVDYH